MRLKQHVFGLVLVAALALTPVAASADSTRNEVLYGSGSALASLLYAPAKLVYAAGGSVVAGLAFLWSAGDRDVVRPILDAALRGDYVITPDHLRGERGVEFVGRSPEQRYLRSNVGSGPPAETQKMESDEIYTEGF